MKRAKVIYWISTLLVCAVFGFSIYIHLLKTDMVESFYESLGFPAWLVIPSGVAKVFALIAILSDQSRFLKEWAYAGLFYDAILAFTASQVADDGGWMFSAIAIVALIVSRVMWGYRSRNIDLKNNNS